MIEAQEPVPSQRPFIERQKALNERYRDRTISGNLRHFMDALFSEEIPVTDYITRSQSGGR